MVPASKAWYGDSKAESCGRGGGSAQTEVGRCDDVVAEKRSGLGCLVMASREVLPRNMGVETGDGSPEASCRRRLARREEKKAAKKAAKKKSKEELPTHIDEKAVAVTGDANSEKTEEEKPFELKNLNLKVEGRVLL